MKRKTSVKGKNKAIFEELLRDIRIDFGHLRKLHEVLVNKISTEPQEENIVVRQEIMEWILDVLVDKAYDLESKVGIIFKKVMSQEVPVNVNNAVTEFRRVALTVVSGRNDPLEPYDYLDNLRHASNELVNNVEWSLSEMRQKLWLSDWKYKSTLNPSELIGLQRKKYVKAREEITRARELSQDHPEDVMGYLRTAIDLAIKERFGFKKIPKMIKFIDKAKELDFPLPSYDTIYYYFNEASKRLHEGRVHTFFEVKEAIRTVSTASAGWNISHADSR